MNASPLRYVTIPAVMFCVCAHLFAAEKKITRAPDEDVNSAAVRERQNLSPEKNILFNGWGLTPAGEHVRISDMPLKMLVAPDRKTLVVVSGGFNNTGLALLDIKTRKVTQFLPLKEC